MSFIWRDDQERSSHCSYVDENGMVNCPYNKTHVVYYKAYKKHLDRCATDNAWQDLHVCPFNWRHRVKNIYSHLRSCPDSNDNLLFTVSDVHIYARSAVREMLLTCLENI